MVCERCYTIFEGGMCHSLTCVRHRKYLADRTRSKWEINADVRNRERFNLRRLEKGGRNTVVHSCGTLQKGPGGGVRVIRSGKAMS